jgi:hypothetical protein
MTQISISFVLHFVLSFLGFLFLGIYLCRGTWRNRLRKPLALAVGFVALGHLFGAHGTISTVIYVGLILFFGWQFVSGFRNANYVLSDVRAGHNAFSLLAGTALFALAVQLHGVVIGVPVFQLVK